MRDLPPRRRRVARHSVDRRPASRNLRAGPEGVSPEAARQSDHADDCGAPERRRDGGACCLFRQPAGATVMNVHRSAAMRLAPSVNEAVQSFLGGRLNRCVTSYAPARAVAVSRALKSLLSVFFFNLSLLG